MSTKTHEIVKVTMQGGKLTCIPDWVHLNWKEGPADIRWVFEDMPTGAVAATVEFLPTVPAKYPTPPAAPAVFRPRGVHRGTTQAPASGSSQVNDIVTTGNTQQGGYFFYDVKLLDRAGKVLAETDPGGDNNPGGGGPN